MSHYHVGHNMPGYMSESDVIVAGCRADAVRVLIDEKRYWLDSDENHDLVFHGDARRDLGYYVWDRSMEEFVSVFWAVECFEDDCEEEEF